MALTNSNQQETVVSSAQSFSLALKSLNKGVDELISSIRSLPEMKSAIHRTLIEIESIHAFLETFNLIKDTMPEARLRDTMRSTVKSVWKLYDSIPPPIRQKFKRIQIDPKINLPLFLVETFRFIGPNQRISRNEMKAFIEIDSNDVQFYTPDSIVKNLKQNGVIRGIDLNAINSVLKHSLFDQEVCVAKGKPPKPGKDGYLQYDVNVEDLGRTPKELENGRVSFKDIDLFTYVNAGDVIVHKIPSTPGTSGYTVTNRMLPASKPHEAELFPFENTKISKDETKLIAAVDGCITKHNGRIHLKPTLHVQGNISYETGNIDSRVTVYVNHDVMSGFSVRSEQDIYVQGVVEGAHLEAKGNIIIKGGIQGKDKAVIEANGDITARFINNAKVSSLSNIYADSGIINSSIWAGNRLVLSNPNAEIVGGEMNADSVVVTGTIGSEMGVKTIIRLGTRTEELASLIFETQQKIAEQEENRDKCIQIIDMLKQRTSQSLEESDNAEKALDKATQIFNTTKAAIQDLYAELDGIQTQYEESIKCLRSIRSRKNILPGTLITIQGVEMAIQSPTGPSTIVKQGESLIVLPFTEMNE